MIRAEAEHVFGEVYLVTKAEALSKTMQSEAPAGSLRGYAGYVARYLHRIVLRGDPGKKRLSFLGNHREAIVGLDFFTVPTATLRVLYCPLVIEHGSRRILHFNVTRHPSADWVVAQLRESFPKADPYRYAILDRDSIFDAGVITFLKVTGLRPKRTSRQSPWQNGTAERWIGSPPGDARSCHRTEREVAASLNP